MADKVNKTDLSNKNFIRDLVQAVESAFATKPKDVSGIDNMSSAYYFQYLLRLVKGKLEIETPDYWDGDFLLDTLLLDGVFGIFEHNSEPLAMNCHPYGVNMYYKPTSFTIANPVLGTFKKTIGLDGELVYLEEEPTVSGSFRTIRPLLTKYAYQLAACDKCIDQSLMNSGVAAIFSASSKKAAESYRLMYDEISEGKPAVFVDEELGLGSQNSRSLQYTPAKDNYICDKVQIEKRCLIEEFLTAIGIQNANTDKRERLNSDEVNSNNEECFIATAVWRYNLEECVKRVKKLYPDLKFNIRIREMSIIDNSTPDASPKEVGENEDVEKGDDEKDKEKGGEE